MVLCGVYVQFYDHYIDWEEQRVPIKKLMDIRKRNGINPKSSVNILIAQADLYMAKIDNKVVVKIGPNGDLKNLLPQNAALATSGQDFAVWELH